MPNQTIKSALVKSSGRSLARTRIDVLAMVPEEQVWLAGLKSVRTKLAYQRDMQHFIATLGIRSLDELRRADHKAVTLWEAHMRERERREASTIRRRLSALSSLFTHLVNHGVVRENPVREVKRPRIERRQGKTLAFSKKQARAILDAPDSGNPQGLRDRAILAVGLQVGFRRSEIASLQVKSLHQNRGFDSLWVRRKGGKRHSVAIHPQVAQRIRDYLAAAGHAADLDGPMFRPVRHNQRTREDRRAPDSDAINRIVHKYGRAVGVDRGYSAHSMRSTFITTALDNGASLEDVQRDVGHEDPSTTKLYDRRGHNPEKSASFFANY